jgi:outer membrane lipoprotein-sorting protein
MSVLTSRPVLRWVVPAAVALAVLGGGAAIGAITAAADPTLPTRTPAELIADLETAHVDGLSGTIVTRADLGLPALPIGNADGVDLSGLLTGTHTVRVWYSGPDKARVALLNTLGETDLIANGTDLWTWSSQANKATHQTISLASLPKLPGLGSGLGFGGGLGGGLGGDKTAGPTPSALAGAGVTPQQIASLALAALSPTTDVTAHGVDSIAGRSAYELVLTPKDPTSLIGSIRLALDAQTHVPLRAQVFAVDDSSPAIEVAFTAVSFDKPDPAEFTFNPPPGTTVVNGDAAKPDQPDQPATPPSGAPHFALVGAGWTTVVAVRSANLIPSAIVASLPPVSGSWGSGHLLKSKLANVLVTDDGRVLIGAVTTDRLYQAAADPAAKLTS